MATLFYKDYAVTAEVKRDVFSRKYKPIIRIVWNTTDGKRGRRSFTLPKQCTSEEANSVAFREAKAWADRWLTHLGV